MQELQNELNRGFEAEMRVFSNKLMLIRDDMQRVWNQLATAEDLYANAFSKLAQHLNTHPLYAYEEIRKQAREKFEEIKNIFFSDLDGFKPLIDEKDQKIQEILKEVNDMIENGYNNNEQIEVVLDLSLQAKNYIHNCNHAIQRTKKIIEKQTLS